MGEGAWDIRGKELWLLDPEGNARVSKVDEVYRALIEKRPSEKWIPAHVEGLRPSRYPLDPVVVIDDAEGDGVPVFSLSGSCRGKTITLQPDDLERGHVVADGVWYPV
ncbi:MAG TPA: hypothetical protein VJQ77_02755, partial [Novosphingobium sp.]|nr:hypothetical protein [Novosphingobium sp.]